MSVYLIDYENVRSDGIRGVDTLSENDEVYIFHSMNADTLTFDAHDQLLASRASVFRYKIQKGGKNALDFQLSSFLGYLISEKKSSSFYIISNDNGFNFVMEFWKNQQKDLNVSIVRASSIEKTFLTETEPETTVSEETEDIETNVEIVDESPQIINLISSGDTTEQQTTEITEETIKQKKPKTRRYNRKKASSATES